jgi:hypothetical protein
MPAPGPTIAAGRGVIGNQQKLNHYQDLEDNMNAEDEAELALLTRKIDVNRLLKAYGPKPLWFWDDEVLWSIQAVTRLAFSVKPNPNWN